MKPCDNQIPSDLVVKCQGIDNAEVIFPADLATDHRPNIMSTQDMRCEPLSLSQAHRFTTKSDGMWNRPSNWKMLVIWKSKFGVSINRKNL
jgi:hypothetical protein